MLPLLLTVPALPVLACSTYLGVLALQARPLGRELPPSPETRFDVVVPAHDEEAGIGATVQSLLDLDYPREMFRVLVVADNCADATATRAEEAGASVLIRQDLGHKGKGYALEFAFAHSRSAGFADAVVVVDADTTVSKNLLRSFDAAFRRGAQAVQAEYGVRNPDAGWRTRLMSVALSLHHRLRNLARERMGLSLGLHGNGMAFSHQVLEEVPHRAYSIVEDLEYGIALGRAGHRVHYAAEGAVYGEMVATETASRSQRQRWEGGRASFARDQALGLLVDGVLRREKILFDLGMDLAVPPLSYLVAGAGGGLLISSGAVLLLPVSALVTLPWLLACGSLVGYVLRGVALSERGAAAFVDLAWAPAYIGWKFALRLTGERPPGGEWIRTQRNA